MQTTYNPSEYEKAIDLKGYGFHEYEVGYFKEKLTQNSDFKLPDDKRSEAEKVKTCLYDGLKVRPVVIESFEQYIAEISKLETSLQNPLFYRGHTNANYYLIPNVFRRHTDKERLLYNEFMRRFYSELSNCSNSFEKLVFMQHYKMETRALDISESPLLGLFFACADDKRFRTDADGNKYKWGEVILFRAPENEETAASNYEDVIKYPGSSTVSVMACTGFMDFEFNLQKLENEFRNDGHLAAVSESINFRDILSHSVIVRAKLDNKRIYNQQGAFIMLNANEIIAPGLNQKSFTDFVLGSSTDVNLFNLKNGCFSNYSNYFANTNADSIRFRKVKPYSPSYKTTNPRMYYDPFNIRRFLYKNSSGEQVVFLIPPTAKKHILEQLEMMNITDAFVYPEMDSVCNEICLKL